MASEHTSLLRASSLISPASLWRSGAAFAATGVIAAAFGAHILKNRPGMDSQTIHGWETASHYFIYNGLTLMLLSMHPRFAAHRFAGPAIAVGGLVFSSTIMALALNRDRFKYLGPLTPIAGTVMAAG